MAKHKVRGYYEESYPPPSLLVGFSAFMMRLFIDTGLIENNIWLNLFHLIILVQWALISVPFGKWAHFLYRSFAMYFSKIKSQ
jgi:hypothetical protein